ncbi:hypothetical protein ORIO_20820 (plasmid) [Cereibacter azotoformans]|nr:hypothetical protein [Cereibacter azotoformans]UIJ32975.1 hypothetical protein LV780_20645 [Cereibacter azotoformans]ULB12242.1 hypothetical protein ORIO_20820 [Cereibacter azotoformans]
MIDREQARRTTRCASRRACALFQSLGSLDRIDRQRSALITAPARHCA